MREFGRTEYKKCVYVNFENAMSLKDLFTKDYDIVRIISSLQIFSKTIINADDTLIIFNEIQAVKGGLTSLKFFCENAPQYHLIAAGSLL